MSCCLEFVSMNMSNGIYPLPLLKHRYSVFILVICTTSCHVKARWLNLKMFFTCRFRYRCNVVGIYWFSDIYLFLME